MLKEENNIKDLSKYKDIYHLSILWWDNEFGKCDVQFIEKYSGKLYCFNKVDAKQAKKLIEKKKSFRTLSLGNIKKN